MSDASAGQIVGGVVGAVVGFLYAGGPVGAVQGFAIGYGLGGYVDPPEGPLITAPRLDNLTFQSSTYGAPIPKLYGTTAVHGNVIYLENGKYKQVVTEEEQDGKGGGGGATVETVSYFATFAVSLGEEMAGAQVRRVWLGAKLIYNASAPEVGQPYLNSAGTPIQSYNNSKGFKFYDGTQTEPDSRIESAVGVGNAESYEGTAYIMFYDLALEKYGNSLQGAPVKVEIATSNNADPVLIDEFAQPYELPSDANTGLSAQPQSFKGLSFGWCISYGTFGNKNNIGYTNNSSDSWVVSEGSEINPTGDLDAPYGLNDQGLIFNSSRQAIGVSYAEEADVGNLVADGYQTRGVIGDGGVWVGITTFDDKIHTSPTNGITHPPTGICVAVDEGLEYVYLMTTTQVIKYTADLSVLVASKSHGITGTPVSVARNSRLWHNEGRLWIGTSDNGCTSAGPDTFYSIDDSLTGSVDLTYSLPQTVTVNKTWTGSSEFAIYDGILFRAFPDGNQSGDMHYEQWLVDGVEKYKAPLDEIVDSISTASGVSGSDLSGISAESLRGYSVLPSDARGALSQLQAAFLFDLVQDGYNLKAVKRGGAPVLSIPYGDLGAMSAGDSPSDILVKSREMDTQLPSRYDVTYVDNSREYDTAVQSGYFPTTAENTKSIELAVVFTPNEAAKLADILINLAWISRDTFSFKLPQKYLDLNVSDVVTIETPDREYEVRIESINEAENQTLEVTGRLSSPALYQSDAVGSTGPEPSEEVAYIGDSVALLADIPMILNSTDYPNITASMYGLGQWDGGSLFKSVDTGQTFTNVQSFINRANFATALNVIGQNDGFVIDRESELLISVQSGSFPAITEEQMMAGLGWVAYGADQRWEIIRYSDSVINADGTVTLSGLIRGHRGTEQYTGTHQNGDLVVGLAPSNTYPIGADLERLGVQTVYKAVTIGQNITEVDPLVGTYRGVNLKPLSPVLPLGDLAGDDWDMSATTRTRYTGSFWTSGVQPINETVLSYELDILDGLSVVRTLSSSSLQFTYTLAEQVEDFGSKQQALSVNYYQTSQRVGRGSALSASFDATSILDFDNPSLQAAYTMDNISGTTLVDESPNGNDITLTGTSTIAGVIGDALSFSGNSPAITVPVDYGTFNSVLTLSGDFSLCGWANNLIADNWLTMLGGNTGGQDDSLRLNVTGGQWVGYAAINDVGAFTPNIAAYSAGWHFFSFVREGGTLYVSIDDSPAQSVAFSTLNMQIEWLGIINTTANGVNLTSALDQVRVFDRALSPVEVNELYNEV